ncbi:MAG TPA: c-type cytochrome [Stellaceae bacterium]|jgi:cytochrome c553|nr:c-type cytochrome [Stellaceae bacterium]
MTARAWLQDRWVVTSVAITAAFACAAILLGFVILPLLQGNRLYAGLWDAICSAAGVLTHSAPTPIVTGRQATTKVVLTPTMLQPADAEAIGRGATLAQNCTMCHGARGLSPADSPNLAGQYPFFLYKELKDFQSGARESGVMQPLVANLSDRDLRDLAAYYAYLPRLPGVHTGPRRPAVVIYGAPLRGIAPCGSCHGALDYKLGSAWLEEQPEVYLRTQLEAFASGARRNDIEGVMRNIARQMTPDEIAAAAKYYADTPPP